MTSKKQNTKKEAFKVTAYSFKDVDKHIGDVQGKAKTLKVKIHSLAVAILKHWHDHQQDGQICADKLTALMNASPYHTRAFSEWCGVMVPMQWSQENKAWFVHKDDKIMGKQFIACRDTPFWELSPPKEARPFIMAQEIERILKKAEAHSKKPVEGDEMGVAALKHLREALKAVSNA